MRLSGVAIPSGNALYLGDCHGWWRTLAMTDHITGPFDSLHSLRMTKVII